MNQRRIENKNLSAKELFINRMNELPGPVQAALNAKQIKVSDHEYYAIIKANGAANLELFPKTLAEGAQTNVHQGIVPTDQYFLVTSIVVTSDVGGAGSTIADACALPFDEIAAAIRNAKFTFKNGQDTYMEKCGGGVFSRTERDSLELGEHKLENPKFLYSKQPISFELQELGAALVAETWVKVRLKGVVTTKK
jgi:hypothetical protein